MNKKNVSRINDLLSKIDSEKYNTDAFNELYSLIHDSAYFQKNIPFRKHGVVENFELDYKNSIVKKNFELRNTLTNKIYQISKNYLSGNKSYTISDFHDGKESVLEKSVILR
jgi:hypothetical protein